MRISDWSSDVCSSDLHAALRGLREDKPASDIVIETEVAPASTSRQQRPKAVLTHPDRLYWPDAGVNKAGLADYYAEVWTHIAPYITGRPLSLVPCPGGITIGRAACRARVCEVGEISGGAGGRKK